MVTFIDFFSGIGGFHSGFSDFPAKMSVSQESNEALEEEHDLDSFMKLCASLTNAKKINPNGLSAKMLEIYCLLRGGKECLQYSLKWTKEGMMRNGKFLIPKTMEYHKTEKGSILLDALEMEVPSRYYLQSDKVLQLLGKL